MRGWDGLVLSNGATTLAVPLLVGLGTSSADSGNHVRRNTASPRTPKPWHSFGYKLRSARGGPACFKLGA